MKKLFYSLFALMVIASSSVSAQTIFSENFNASTSLPAGWTQANQDGLTVVTNLSAYGFGTNAWVIYASGWAQTAGDKAAISTSWYTPAGISNDWLISAPISVTAGNFLTWKAMAPDQNYADGYIVKISTTTNAVSAFTTDLLTVAGADGSWTSKYIDLSAYAGQTVYIAWVNNSNDKYLLGIDDVATFIPPAADITVNSVSPLLGSTASFGTVGQTKTIVVNVTNHAATAVTSIDGSYTADGGAPVNQTFTTNIAPFASANLTFTTPYSISAVGDHIIDVTMTLSGDVNTSDNTGTTTIGGAAFVPVHVLTIEEGTGTWCGWCPRGAVYMDSMRAVNPTSTALIAVHNSDPMTVTDYDAGVGGFISGYPSILVDRKAVYDPSDIFTAYDDYINDFGFANITATQSYNASTKVSTVNATANFAVSSTSDLRLTCVYIEDGVHGTTTSYDQHNYYSNQTNNLPLQGAGHNWQLETDPVLAANMYYDHVARTILGGFTGVAGSLPNPITGGNSYSHTFTYTIPTTSTPDNVSVIVLLINATTGQILNATTPKSVTGISDLKSQIDQLSVYPNPTADELNVLFTLNKAQNVSFEVTDVMGRIVSTTSFKNLAPTNQNIQLSVADLATGVYFLNIKTDSGIVSRRFVKN